jgi:hypothetical protein
MKALLFLVLFCGALATTEEEWIRRSGIGLKDAPRLKPEVWPTGTSFAGVFTDHAVLQRAPAKAAVFGVVIGDKGELGSMGAVGVAVTVQASGGADAYTVQAEHIDVVNSTYARWKAFLKPSPAGGEYSISAKCSGCTNTTVKTLTDVTFGDIWFCSGQSNSKASVLSPCAMLVSLRSLVICSVAACALQLVSQ